MHGNGKRSTPRSETQEWIREMVLGGTKQTLINDAYTALGAALTAYFARDAERAEVGEGQTGYVLDCLSALRAMPDPPLEVVTPLSRAAIFVHNMTNRKVVKKHG